jgi:hypothetical protein
VTPPLPPGGNVDLTFLYQLIRDMDVKLDRLIETFATVREVAKLEARVVDLETRWRRNAGWVVALIGALTSAAYFVAYLIGGSP